MFWFGHVSANRTEVSCVEESGETNGRCVMRRFATWLMVGGLVTTGATTALADSGNFGTHLTGGEEVPAVVTGAQGQATFKLSADGQSITYKLNVANIEDVIQAHIHLASLGVNGNVVTFLFGPVAGGVDVNGRLASGSIEAGDLINYFSGPTAGVR